jgi:hypothetical protein
MSQPSTSDILHRAVETLETARMGLGDVRNDASRRLSGLRNLVVFGRAVTNVLQNLRSTEPTFERWYEKVQRDLKSDPLMKFFYNLRTQILKRGDVGVAAYTHIKSFQLSTDMRKFGDPPRNAKAFFIGDSNGGTGWEVEVSPGVVEKYYVELPSEIGAASLYFRDAPNITDSGNDEDSDVVSLSAKYLDQLSDIVEDAERSFGGIGDV